VIAERIRKYEPKSRRRDWDEEVRVLGFGGALILLKGLAPLAFPEQTDAIEAFAKHLDRLRELLNADSHDNEDNPDPSATLNETPMRVQQLLKTAEQFLGELPWHLEVSVICGDQPKVLSGEAWSAGSAAPRLLRVID
jgi:hypothetical protein